MSKTTSYPLSPRNHPLLSIPHPETALITLENYEKWYEVYVLHSDGTVEVVPVEVIDLCDRELDVVGKMDHCYHPKLLEAIAIYYGDEVEQVVLEVALGRWMNNINAQITFE